jgi:hypothetical protein
MVHDFISRMLEFIKILMLVRFAKGTAAINEQFEICHGQFHGKPLLFGLFSWPKSQSL